MANRLKIAFLLGGDDPSKQSLIDQICSIEGVDPVLVLIDGGGAAGGQRWRNLKRNIRREGLSYVFYRFVSALRETLERRADRIVPGAEVDELLRSAFPDLGMDRLAQRHRFRVVKVDNLNGEAGQQTLREAQVDVGIAVGTRILKPALFTIPRYGCLNLHKGRVPEYRGMPPGFWELFDGRDHAGITVHFIDAGLDTGDIVATSEVAIHPKETPESLRAKLDQEGAALLASVVEQWCSTGSVERRAQQPSSHKPGTRPTRAQREELARRLPHWRRLGDLRQILKLTVWLMVFYGGIFRLVRWMRRDSSRGAILLYHRVNDVSEDVLTTSTRRFAEHLVTLKHYYRVPSTQELVSKIAGRQPLPVTSVAIHFDDCYRDVRTCAAPLLKAAGMPGTSFVSSGFIDTERVFQHDKEKYPHHFENLNSQDVREFSEMGLEVAAHTVNHVDLGKVSLAQAEVEIVESRRQLETLLGHPVLLFSFPFGGYSNIREEVRERVVSAGYRALFSAHGGFVGPATTLFDIPRCGVSSDHSALALLMELEGISLANLKQWIRACFRTA